MAPKKPTTLTDQAIKGAKKGKYVTRLYDGATPGLQLVIAPSGTKTFAIRFTSPITGKRRSMTLGQYDDMSLAQARSAVEDTRSLIRGGIDPIDKSEQEEAEQVAENAVGTVEDLFAFYIQDMQRKKRKSWNVVQSSYDKNIAVIGKMKARDVTAQDIARKVLAPIFKRGAEVQANRVRSYMYSAFQLGLTVANSARHADVPDFGLVFNPVTVVPVEGKESAGERTLDKAEVKRLWKEIGTRNNMTKDSALAVKLILSTGQRVTEVLQAQWTEFDLEGKTWSIPAERRKTHWKVQSNEPHIVPLTDLHIELLNELQGMARRQKFLFPDPTGKAARKTDGLQQAIKRYCLPGITNKTRVKDYSNEGVRSDRLPFEYFTPRNLRRTFKTLAGEAGLSKEIRDRLQGHSQADLSSRHYDRYDYFDDKQKAMQKWSNWLSRQVGMKKAKVVPIREVG